MELDAASGQAKSWVQVLSNLHYGLYFLSSGREQDPRGLLVSWVSQVGGDPPLILCAVRENRAILPVLEQKMAFALNLLPGGASDMVSKLARPSIQRFSGIALETGWQDLPLLKDAAGTICCRVREILHPGDHLLFLGQVEKAQWKGPGPVMNVAEVGHAYLGLS